MKLIERVKSINILHLYILLMFILPFSNSTFFPGSYFKYVLPLLAMVPILIVYILRVANLRNFFTDFRKVLDLSTAALLALAIWGGVSILSALDHTKSLIYFGGSLVVFFVGWVLARLLSNKSWGRQIFYVVTVVGIVFLLLGIFVEPAIRYDIYLIDSAIPVFESVPVLYSVMASSGYFGLLLFYAVTSGLVLLLTEKKRSAVLFLIASVLSMTVALFLTFSRASLMALSIFLVLFLPITLRRSIFLTVYTILVLVISLSLVTGLGIRVYRAGANDPTLVTTSRKLDDAKAPSKAKVNEVSLALPDDSNLSGRAKYDSAGRLALWLASWDWLKQHPFFGAGLGNSPGAIGPLINEGLSRYQGLSPHNTFLRTAVELGLPGLLFYLVFLGSVGIVLLKKFLIPRVRGESGFLGLVMIIFAALSYQLFVTTFSLGLGFINFYFLILISLAISFPVDRNLPKKIQS